MFRIIGSPDEIFFTHPITNNNIPASKLYISWHDNLGNAAIAGGQRIILGKSWKIVNIKWLTTTNTGNTTISIYKNEDTTAIVSNTQAPGGSNILLSWLGINIDFLGGDRAHISITPTSVSSTDLHMAVDYAFTEIL